MADDCTSRVAELALDIRKGVAPDAIVAEARAIWSGYWGPSGSSGELFRRNFSRKKLPAMRVSSREGKGAASHAGKGASSHAGEAAAGLADAMMTEASFVRKRRRDVQAGVSSDDPMTRAEVLNVAKDASAAVWGDTHQKQADWYAEGQANTKARALLGDNAVLASEVAAEVAATSAKERAASKKTITSTI